MPLYDFPSQRVIEHFVPEMPVRVSALRSLGAFANVFAIESFMDELAAAAAVDPVEFRLRHLSDARGRAVIEAAARAAGWKSTPTSGADGPLAAAASRFARYKNQAAYVALVAEVAVDRADGTIRVERMTAAVDAGDVVNPDGLRNQIEGGMMQAASWTLFEEVAFDRERITSVDWRSYPIARFPTAPVVSVEVIERPERSAGRRRRGGSGSRRGGDRQRRLRGDRSAPARPAAAAAARSRGVGFFGAKTK